MLTRKETKQGKTYRQPSLSPRQFRVSRRAPNMPLRSTSDQQTVSVLGLLNNISQKQQLPNTCRHVESVLELWERGGAAAWAGWAMDNPKFWLGRPQCTWSACSFILREISKNWCHQTLDFKAKCTKFAAP